MLRRIVSMSQSAPWWRSVRFVASDSSMKGELYNKTSRDQLSAHTFAEKALDNCVARSARLPSTGPFVVTDMGCASGANSIPVVRHVVEGLRAHGHQGDISFYHSDLPQTDFNTFMTTFHQARSDGAIDDSVFTNAMGRSFYEPLLPQRSVQLHLSYIALHWMSKVPCPVPGMNACIHDDCVPAAVLDTWREQALKDLVLYFQLRAKELVDGGECLTLMVAHNLPDRPQFTSATESAPSVFNEAIALAVKASEIPEHMAVRATIPYFLRQEADVKKALDAVPNLELMELCHDMVPWASGEGTDEGTTRMAALAWAIHANSLQASMGASDEQMAQLRVHLDTAVRNTYYGKVLEVGFLYVTVRRRQRDS